MALQGDINFPIQRVAGIRYYVNAISTTVDKGDPFERTTTTYQAQVSNVQIGKLTDEELEARKELDEMYKETRTFEVYTRRESDRQRNEDESKWKAGDEKLRQDLLTARQDDIDALRSTTAQHQREIDELRQEDIRALEATKRKVEEVQDILKVELTRGLSEIARNAMAQSPTLQTAIARDGEFQNAVTENVMARLQVPILERINELNEKCKQLDARITRLESEQDETIARLVEERVTALNKEILARLEKLEKPTA